MGKLSTDGRNGGLLVGKTDKSGGIGIPATVGGSRNVILGGGEIIINEEAARQNCKELSRINESTGGRHIDCQEQKTANKGRFDKGGRPSGVKSLVILNIKATGKPFKTFMSWWEAAEWIDKNIKEEDYKLYDLQGINKILSTEEVEELLGRPLRLFRDYTVDIHGFQYEKMGLRTTYQRK